MAEFETPEVEKSYKVLSRRVNGVYRQAAEEVQEKINKYLEEFAKEDAIKKTELDSGNITGKKYKAWRRDQMMAGKYWTDMRDALAEDLTNADRIAADLIADELPDVYAIGHNVAAYEMEHATMLDLSYTLYDRRTVEQLLKQDKNLLPSPRVDIPKDKRWNKQHIQSAVLQGILQGEPIPTIAERLKQVTDMNHNASIRNARTAVTGAQNSGRVDGYRHAEIMGIELKKEWLATLDQRTRDSHRKLDGEQVDVDGIFSNGCRFPGDPQGPPGEAYNCRCTLVAAVKGIDQSDAPRNSRLGDMSYEEWKQGHKKKEAFSPDDFKPGQGDAEVTGDVMDMYLTDKARGRIKDAILQIETPRDFENYLNKKGIILETSSEALKGRWGQNTPRAVKQQMEYVIGALEQYDEIGDMSRLKGIHIWESDLDATAEYMYRAKGEGPFPDEGHIYLSQNANAQEVFHEFAHALADSTKPQGMDVVEWSAELNKRAQLSESQGAYTGADIDVFEAERFAQALSQAFAYGNKGRNRLDFLTRVANELRRRKK